MSTSLAARLRRSRRVIANAEIAALLARQGLDGGWGFDSGYLSDALDTAIALQALAAANVSAPAAANGLTYLSQKALADGGWGVADTSSIYVTANVLLAANAWSNKEEANSALAASAITWLLGARNAAEEYGDSFDDAIALLALASVGHSAALPPLASALGADQLADGSWADDPYLTALALRASWLASQPSPGTISLTGRVIDGQTNLALSDASITLSGPQSYALNTDGGGIFFFSSIAPGQYALTIAKAGFNTTTATILAASGQALDIGTIALLPSSSASLTTGTVKGTATDAATNAPIDGATITVNGVGVLTATDGSYEVPSVPAGPITVSAAANGYQTAAGTGSLPAGGILLFSPQLSAGTAAGSSAASLVGTVTDAGTHQPIVGATITVSGAASAVAHTDSNGSYGLTGLSVGTVQILASASGYESVGAATQFQLNTTVTFSPTLFSAGTSPSSANTAGVDGVVVDSTTDAPLANVAIVAKSPDGSTQNLVTAADGSFFVTGLTQEQVVLSFSQDGYVSAEFTAWTLPLLDVDIGQVRLRPTSANVLLPDSTVTTVDSRAAASSDPQTFR